jgi:hypothetical protein
MGKKKDHISLTERKMLCCHGQAQRMTDERRQEIERLWLFLERRSTRTSKEIPHKGVQVTVSDREQTAGQWIERSKSLLDPEDEKSHRPGDSLCIFRHVVVRYIMLCFNGGKRT